MNEMENIKNQIAEEAVMMNTGDLTGCGKILRLLEKLPDSDMKTAVNDVVNNIIITEFADKDTQLNNLQSAVNNLIAGKTEPASESKPPETKKETVKTEEAKIDEPFSLSEEDIELLGDFLDESTEHIDSIEGNMMKWEDNPQDLEIINAIFRPFHTIKGTSGFLNLPEINRVAHNLENLLDNVRNGKLSYSDTISNLIFKGVDTLRIMLNSVRKSITEKTQPVYDDKVIDIFMDEIDAVDSGQDKKIGELLVEKGKVKVDDVENALKSQITSDKKIGELLVEKGRIDKQTLQEAVDVQKQAADLRAMSKIAKFVKVDTEKLDNLMDMIGELVINQHMIVQNPNVTAIKDSRLIKDVAQLKRIVATLQNVGMSMRMVELKPLFQKMKRLVRDLAKKTGKKIDIVFEGEETEMDRNMVEEMYDPLVHIVRNSCDHGIGMPDERVMNDKPETGLLKISAFHKGSSIVIQITDDGRGMNREQILKKAIEKGLVEEGHLLTDNEIYKLIFMPGFSTAAKITNISGRGVGLDVVKKSVEKLRGKIEVESKVGAGTTVSCILPLTLAIIDGMLIKVGDQKYILPTLSVRQSLRPLASQIHAIAGKGEVVSVMDKLLPLIRLKELFNLKKGSDDPTNALVIVVENDGTDVCLMVDELIGKQEVVIKNLGRLLGDIRGIAGCAILGDGTVGLILDASDIVSETGGQFLIEKAV